MLTNYAVDHIINMHGFVLVFSLPPKIPTKKSLKSEAESVLYILSLDMAMDRPPNAECLRTTDAGNEVCVALQQVESLYVLRGPAKAMVKLEATQHYPKKESQWKQIEQ